MIAANEPKVLARRPRPAAPRRLVGARAAVAALLVVAAGSCGKEGNPLPPLRPEPGHIREVSATRNATAIDVRMTIPAENFDGTTPPVIERVEIYAATMPATAVAPGATELFNEKFLYKVIPVRRDETAPAVDKPTPNAKLPAPGETYVFTDVVDQAQLTAADTPIRYYLVAGATGRSRRGRPSPVLPVPLTQSPTPPAKIDMKHDEQSVTLSWAAVEGQTYTVRELGPRAAIDPGTLLTADPLKEPSLSLPAWFGTERCFTVQPIATTGRVSIVGPAGGPFCFSPADTFAPPAPGGLLAIQDERGIALRWSGVEAADLAGYIVLRAEGTSETLQGLFRAPIAETTYVDKAITAGVTYTYAVIAIDKAGNVSPQSGRQQVTARSAPGPRSRTY